MKTIRLAIVFITALSTGCAGQPAHEERGVDIVDRCAEVLSLATNIFAPDRYSFIAEHCVAPMVSEPRCRAAVMRSIGVDASTRNTLVSSACTKAYCPRMSAPKPGLCTAELTALSPAEALPLGMEFFGEVRRMELDAAELARWQERIGSEDAPPRVATAPPPSAEPTPAVAPPSSVGPRPSAAPKEPAAPRSPAEPADTRPPKEAGPSRPPVDFVPTAPKPAARPEPTKVAAPPPAREVVAPPPAREVVAPPPAREVVAPPPAREAVAPPIAKTDTSPAKPPAGPVAVPRSPSSGAVTLRMTIDARKLSIAVGGQSWPLGEEPSPSAFEPAAMRAVELGAREQRVVVELGPGIQYNHLVGILNALGRQYVSNISLQSIKP